MNELIVHVNWEYFLGIIGVLIGLAWYASAKFSKMETAIDWIRDSINGLRGDLTEMRKDVNELRNNVNELRTDVDNLTHRRDLA